MEEHDGPGLGPSSTPDSCQWSRRRVPLVKSQQESSDAGSESNLARTGWFRVSATLARAKERVEIAEPVESVEDLHFCPWRSDQGDGITMGCAWCYFAGGRALCLTGPIP